MAGRPLIGLPTQTLEEVLGERPLCWVMSQRYALTLTQAGATPFIIPLLEDEAALRDIYEHLDGVFLCGGVDIGPTEYGHPKHNLCGTVDEARDRTELQLVRWAMEDQKPVFGVCRGVQVINVAHGGTLVQDIAHDVPSAIKHDYFPIHGRYARDLLVHSIEIDVESRLGRMLGVRSLKVNSLHHQAIKDLGQGLMPTAWAPDGVVEAVEAVTGHYMVGVQWHPEELAATDPRMRRLFRQFIQECRHARLSRTHDYEDAQPQPMMLAA